MAGWFASTGKRYYSCLRVFETLRYTCEKMAYKKVLAWKESACISISRLVFRHINKQGVHLKFKRAIIAHAAKIRLTNKFL